MKKTFFQLLNEIVDYCPANHRITSVEEIDMLNKHFDLENMAAYDLQNLRDMTVLFFSCHAEAVAETNRERMYKYDLAMYSITTIIDYYIYKAEYNNNAE